MEVGKILWEMQKGNDWYCVVEETEPQARYVLYQQRDQHLFRNVLNSKKADTLLFGSLDWEREYPWRELEKCIHEIPEKNA